MRYRAYHVLMPALVAAAVSIWSPLLLWLWGGIKRQSLGGLIIFLAVALVTGGLGIYYTRRIRSGELKPDQRHYVWLPGLFGAAFYMSTPYLFVEWHIGNHFGNSWIIGKTIISVWYSQLIAVVPVGAMVAYWSRSAGGARKHQILAVTYPCLVYGIVFLWMCLYNFSVGSFDVLHTLGSFLASQVLLPGLASLLGALPCLVGGPHRPSGHGVAHLAHS